MCMQDWRIGRFVRSVVNLQNLAVPSMTLTASKQRVGVMISCDQPVGLGSDSLQVLIGGKIIYSVDCEADPYLMMTLVTHGDLVQKQILIQSKSQTVNVCAVEFFLTEEQLAAGLDSFNAEHPKWPRST